MDVKARINKKTERVIALTIETETFEEERILDQLEKVFRCGGTITTVTPEGSLLSSFQSADYIEEQDGDD